MSAAPVTTGGSRWAALRGAAGQTGLVPLAILVGFSAVISFDQQAFAVLAPDIRSTFHISTGTTDTIASLTAAVPIIFSVYLGYLGDRTNRLTLTAVCGLLWGVTAIFTGLAPLLVVLVLARSIGGIGFLATETVAPSLLADYYAPDGLGTIFGGYRFLGQGFGLAAGPLAGVIAAIFNWRVSFVVLAVPTFVFVVLLRVLHEPARGLSLGLSLSGPGKLSVMEGYRRVRAIRTARRTWASAFLFGAGTLPFLTLLSTFFKDVYHYGDTRRGELAVLYGITGLIGVACGGIVAQRLTGSGRVRLMPVANAA
ncbi:MAG TPA: MFS transporter, partial [Acidimicrobiales bacterium]|nr:MFS transporter [Acidimicrobiales bacterium]